MRRLFLVTLCLGLTLALAAPALAGFDADAFRKNFVAGLAGRANHPDLTDKNVVVEAAEKAVDFAGTEIYAVKGRLAPDQGQAQPFLLFVSADGRFYMPDLVELSAGKSVLKAARDRVRSGDLKDFGHVILKGAGKAQVIYVSDPFCPFCRESFAYLMARKADMAELRLAHYPLASHPGADIACAILDWARANAPAKLMDYVRFAYTDLAVPHVADRSQENLDKAWNAVAAAFLKRFPELSALGKDGAAIVTRLRESEHVAAVQADMARAADMDIRGTPVIFVNGARVDGFDEERLNTLLK
jgi:protein-disulfide isomerase